MGPPSRHADPASPAGSASALADLEHPSCVNCGSADLRQILVARDLRHRTPGEFPLVECVHCSLKFVRPRPAPAAMGRHYPTTYPAHQKKVGVAKSGAVLCFGRLWDGYQRLFLSKSYPTFFLRRHVQEFRPADRQPRVLDIGCASGEKLNYLKRAGWDVCGVDFSELAIANAHAAGLDQTHVAPGDALPFPDDHFEAVYSWHSLEHHHDPLATLKETFRVLRAGGRAIFAVPSSDSLALRVFGRFWGPLEIPRHLYHFTEKTLAETARLAGLTRRQTFLDFSFYGLFLDQEILESLENLAASRGWRLRFPRPPGLSIAVRILTLPLNGLLGRIWQGGNLIMHFTK